MNENKTNQQWRPVLEDIRQEIAHIHTALEETKFNSDFSHNIQIIKMRTADLVQRLHTLSENMKSEEAAQREQINLMMAEFRRESQKTSSALTQLRIFRTERARANYLHILALQAEAEAMNEEGGEK